MTFAYCHFFTMFLLSLIVQKICYNFVKTTKSELQQFKTKTTTTTTVEIEIKKNEIKKITENKRGNNKDF